MKTKEPCEIEIYTVWDRYGYVATSPQYPVEKSVHTSGPKQSAENLASKIYDGDYRLRYVRRNHYFAGYHKSKTTP